MDQEEIELWYEEEKEKLTDEYHQKLSKVDNNIQHTTDKEELEKIAEHKTKHHDKLKKDFQQSMKALHKKYESKSDKTIKNNLKKYFFNFNLTKIMNKIKAPINNFKERFK